MPLSPSLLCLSLSQSHVTNPSPLLSSCVFLFYFILFFFFVVEIGIIYSGGIVINFEFAMGVYGWD